MRTLTRVKIYLYAYQVNFSFLTLSNILSYSSYDGFDV